LLTMSRIDMNPPAKLDSIEIALPQHAGKARNKH
jgi:hypothetical protein